MTQYEYRVLRAIADESGERRGPIHRRLLIAALDIIGTAERQQLDEHLERLQDQGLVTIVRFMREVRVSLTAQGRREVDLTPPPSHVPPAPAEPGTSTRALVASLAKAQRTMRPQVPQAPAEPPAAPVSVKPAAVAPAANDLLGDAADVLAVTSFAIDHALARIRQLEDAPDTPETRAELSRLHVVAKASQRQWQALGRVVSA